MSICEGEAPLLPIYWFYGF